LAAQLGLLTSEERRLAEGRLSAEDHVFGLARRVSIVPAEANPILNAQGSSPITERVRVADIARRPEAPLHALLLAAGQAADIEATEWAAIELKYAGYLEKERSAAARVAEMEDVPIPEGISYSKLNALSFEAREKLAAIRPGSIGQASRVPGVSPSDVQQLVLAVLRHRSSLRVSRETDPLLGEESFT
jgi:tRNA uridine 5-carboxymethylaminomethyl modification enzyme